MSKVKLDRNTGDSGRVEDPTLVEPMTEGLDAAKREGVGKPTVSPRRTPGGQSWTGAAIATIGLSVAVALIGVLVGLLLGFVTVHLISGFSKQLVVFIVPAAVLSLMLVVMGVRVALPARPKPRLRFGGRGLRRWLVGIAVISAGALLVPAVAEYRSCGWRVKLDDRASVSGCNFSGENLSGLDNPGADLSGANLEGADLTEAKLGRANLLEAKLDGAELAQADLSGANLDLAELARADLSGANLEGAELAEANLSKANLEGAELAEARFFGANLEDSEATNVHLSNADLSRANLEGAELGGADLSGANLERADLAEADLSGANLEGARLPDATGSGADLSRARLSGASLERAELPDANLSGANLERAQLMDVQLPGADLSRATLAGAVLTALDLAGADLEGVRGLPDRTLARALGVRLSGLARALTNRDIVLEERSSVLRAFGKVCRGGRVPAASRYPRGGYRPIVVCGANGRPLTGRAVPKKWAPPAVRFGQLVARVGRPRRQSVGSCGPYVRTGAGPGAPSYTVSRYRFVRQAKVLAARTGKAVSERTFTGSEPPPCQQTVTTSGGPPPDQFGSRPSFGRVRAWLSGFVD
jgi:uncharacterized protein YjbI with pentapeptide repeats